MAVEESNDCRSIENSILTSLSAGCPAPLKAI